MTKETIQERIKGALSPLSLIGAVLGGIGGYIYYIKVGCNSGTCPITSNPWLSVLWGVLFGYLFLDLFRTGKKEKKDSQ